MDGIVNCFELMVSHMDKMDWREGFAPKNLMVSPSFLNFHYNSLCIKLILESYGIQLYAPEGVSPILAIEDVDPVRDFPNDYMHLGTDI